MNFFSYKSLIFACSLSFLLALPTELILAAQPPDVDASGKAVSELATQLQSGASWESLNQQTFASTPLTQEDAERAAKLIGESYLKQLREERSAEMTAQVLRHGEYSMPFFTKVYGEKPEGGRSLYISMHGGGGAPSRVNDRQWENQKSLYSPEEGVYVAPRAPTDTWNLWHQDHIDPLFERLIQNMVVFHDVNPDRVYLMGYSAGGDGVYQLAPRMADYFASAAMMAGHPNETTPDGLRNLPFALFMGGKDAAYKRNEIAKEWKEKLKQLKSNDPKGYTHWVEIYPEYGHWMQKEDAVAVPWMHKFTRNKYPDRIVWKQDDVLHRRFYWLRVPEGKAKARSLIKASLNGQTVEIDLEQSNVKRLNILLNDSILNLDKPVTVIVSEESIIKTNVHRSITNLIESLMERGDPSYLFSSKFELNLSNN